MNTTVHYVKILLFCIRSDGAVADLDLICPAWIRFVHVLFRMEHCTVIVKITIVSGMDRRKFIKETAMG